MLSDGGAKSRLSGNVDGDIVAIEQRRGGDEHQRQRVEHILIHMAGLGLLGEADQRQHDAGHQDTHA